MWSQSIPSPFGFERAFLFGFAGILCPVESGIAGMISLRQGLRPDNDGETNHGETRQSEDGLATP